MFRRPKVEWRRQQVYSVAAHRPGMKHRLDIGASSDGTIAALQHDSHTHGSRASGYIEFGSRTTKMMYGMHSWANPTGPRT